MSEVGIFSTSIDVPTYGPVAENLNSRGYSVWIYNADRIAQGLDVIDIRVNDVEDFEICQNGTRHNLQDLKSAWYRHPYIFNLQIDDKARSLSLEKEIDSLQESIWRQIPDNAWLNHPETMDRSRAKLAQLSLAKLLGFNIPNTLVTNRWSSINKVFEDEPIIIKMSKGIIYNNTKANVLYTTVLSKEQRDGLYGHNPFPGIYQEYLDKKREWRITVVGEDVFEAAVYTDSNAKDDWRKHQFTEGVTFKKESMASSEIEKCWAYLGHLGLIYGAFDFVEDSNGKITFLECNTNGQFRWLEDSLGFPISNAIADRLVDKINQ